MRVGRLGEGKGVIERIGNALCEGRRLGEGEGVIERIGNALCEGIGG